jgi:N-hydroxyarylamine O-acetyltransferase
MALPSRRAPLPIASPTKGTIGFFYVTRDGEQIQGWVSTMEEEYPVDFEMMNHYMATHSASFFTHNILASAVIQEGRVNIMNQDVHIIRNGTAEPAHLADRKALRTLIAQHFGFDLPELETMKVDAVRDWQ